jgi:hypothetical protein
MEGIVHMLLIIAVLSSGCVGVAHEQKTVAVTMPNNNVVSAVINVPVVITPAPTETPCPKPSYTPGLRPYDIDKSSDIWHAWNPPSYIDLTNPYVQYYANHTDDVQIFYTPDNLNPNDPSTSDYWQNVDYTLYTMAGDCEDESIVWVSIHRAKGHKAMVVGGYLQLEDGRSIRDFWYEWVNENGFVIKKIVAPIAYEKSFKAIPKYMFNDQTPWRDYNENWYKN